MAYILSFFMVLNTEQKLFVEDGEFRYTKLYGVPGGGKTRCIIEKILWLRERGTLEGPEDFLVLTFSRQACEDFLRKGQAQDQGLFRTRNIRTIHSTCSSILRDLGKPVGNLTTLVYECLEEMRGGTGSVGDPQGPGPKKKIIFVDEAQDISELQYEWVLELGKKHGCPVLMIGDPNQTIFQFQNGSDRFLLGHPGEAIQLRVNYRSSGEIIRFLNKFRPWDVYGEIEPIKGLPHGSLPRVLVMKRKDALEHLVKELFWKIPRKEWEQVAIIAPIKLSHHTALSLSVVANELYKVGIPFVKHYQDSDTDQTYHHTKEVVPGMVNLFTVHGSKGLEFKRVYLCNFHLEGKGSLPTKEDHIEHRYLWYVGMSRAKRSLTIYGLEDMVLFPSIYTCPKELYDSNRIIELAEGKAIRFRETGREEGNYQAIKQILTTKRWMDEPDLWQLEKLFRYEVREEDMFYVPVELLEYSQYATIYGMFMDDWMFYQTVPLDHYLQCKKRQMEWKVPLDLSLWRRVKRRKIKGGTYERFLEQMEAENALDRKILRRIEEAVPRGCYFEFCIEKEVVVYDKKQYDELVEEVGRATTLMEKIKGIWNLMIFQYQLNFECRYMLDIDFSSHWVTLMPYVEEAMKLKGVFNSNTLFQIPLMEPELGCKGVIDALDDKNNLYEFKFCKETSLVAFLQVFLYAVMYYQHLLHKKVELWNLQTGKRYICEFTADTSEAVREFLRKKLLHEKTLTEGT